MNVMQNLTMQKGGPRKVICFVGVIVTPPALTLPSQGESLVCPLIILILKRNFGT